MYPLPKNCKYLPKNAIKSNITKGEVAGRNSKNVIVAAKQKDKKKIFMTTKHGIETVKLGKRNIKKEVKKPAANELLFQLSLKHYMRAFEHYLKNIY